MPKKVPMKIVQIERKQHLSSTEFIRDHLLGDGSPVIVTDAMNQWPAREKWTFENLKALFGADLVPVSLGFASNIAIVTKLNAFINWLDAPHEDLPGICMDLKNGKPLNARPKLHASAPYLLGWHAFRRHPELFSDMWPPPYFLADWELALSPTLRDVFEWTSGIETTSLYVGPKDSLSPLHQDYWHTHGYLAQLQGTKRVILFSPQDTGFLYDGRVDPEQPDLEKFELFEQATAYSGVIGPNDLLFIPADWWHYVRALEKSITVSHNFFNQSNFSDHMTKFFRNLPQLVQGFEQFPDWRDELGVKWQLADFNKNAD